jgi:SOS-response transcriptional repressor LexA
MPPAHKEEEEKKPKDPTAIIVGQNIKRGRKAKGLSRQKFGEQVLHEGLQHESYATMVKLWENAVRMPEKKNLRLIAAKLEMTVEDLFKGSQRLRYEGQSKGEPVPVIPWRELHLMGTQRESLPVMGHIQPFMFSDEQAFATVILDESMAPEFKNGYVIVVSPATKAQTGDYVLFLLDGAPIFREAHFYFNEILLKPLNSEWEEITIRNDGEHSLSILGVAVQMLKRLK